MAGLRSALELPPGPRPWGARTPCESERCRIASRKRRPGLSAAPVFFRAPSLMQVVPRFSTAVEGQQASPLWGDWFTVYEQRTGALAASRLTNKPRSWTQSSTCDGIYFSVISI